MLHRSRTVYVFYGGLEPQLSSCVKVFKLLRKPGAALSRNHRKQNRRDTQLEDTEGWNTPGNSGELNLTNDTEQAKLPHTRQETNKIKQEVTHSETRITTRERDTRTGLRRTTTGSLTEASDWQRLGVSHSASAVKATLQSPDLHITAAGWDHPGSEHSSQ